MYTFFATEVGASVEEYLERFIEPAWSGSTAYRALIPADELRKVCPGHSVFSGPQQVGSFAIISSDPGSRFRAVLWRE
jgi:hypothetical protein